MGPGALRRIVCGLVVLVTGAGAASAASLGVSPVRATLSVKQQVGALTVRNDGDEPTVVQLETVSWAQQDGKDVYAPTREILATPPIFTIPAGGSQIVRVGLRQAPDPLRESTYRLFLQELPPPPKPGFQGLQVALRIGVPVFVVPVAVARPVLAWKAMRIPEGPVRVTATNSGNAHVQVANFRLAADGDAGTGPHQVATYVLPGQSREWLVKSAAAPGSRLRLSAETDAGDMQAEMIVDRP